MNARDLRPEDRAKLLAPIAREIAYLERLLARMDAAGWDEACPLRTAAADALQATEAMRYELRKCESDTLGSLWMILRSLPKPQRESKSL